MKHTCKMRTTFITSHLFFNLKFTLSSKLEILSLKSQIGKILKIKIIDICMLFVASLLCELPFMTICHPLEKCFLPVEQFTQ
jgi:acetolactate synthase regulatory subunit